jgi:hypothetical protein
MSSRLREWFQGKTERGKVLFGSTRRRLTSVTVRGDQMAEELGGVCLRDRYLCRKTILSSPAVIWVVEANLKLVEKYDRFTPQILDVINPGYGEWQENFNRQVETFRFFLLNTKSSQNYLGPHYRSESRAWVVPHHHCNSTGWTLPQERIETPLVVGYLGQPEHLHDCEEIEHAVRKMGLRFECAPCRQLDGYQKFDIGVAWTRRDAQRDDTRSNIKLVNFAAHGIPSVVCDYESYREADYRLGGVSLIKRDLVDFIDGIRELAVNQEMRQTFSQNGRSNARLYSRQSVGQIYRDIIAEARAITRAELSV